MRWPAGSPPGVRKAAEPNHRNTVRNTVRGSVEAAALAAGGLPALVPAKPGPRRAHKLSEPVLDHLESLLAADPTLRSIELAQAVADRFGISVHPRSVERALARRESPRSSKSG